MGNVLQIIKKKNNTTTSYTDEQNISLSEKIHEEVDKIASHYILTQDASEMLKLKDSSYYDNLIILTRDVILKYLDDSEIEFINEAKKGNKKEKALILNKKEGSSLFTSLDDISNMSSVKRKKMASNIAKFYIKIAHIYAAIASTIDPEYSYTDSNGVEQTFNLQKISELTNLPPHAFSSFKLKTLDNPIALCKKRLDILMNKFDINSKGSVTLNPGEKFCDMNKKEDSSSKSLESESGIHSLKQLYYDVYNYEEGVWDDITPNMKKQFNSDLLDFYKAFTSQDNMPDNIKDFSDIKLKDFHTMDGCSGEDQYYRKDYVGDINDKLFSDYANSIKKMIRDSNTHKAMLLGILKKLFITKTKMVVNGENDSKLVVINPELNLNLLNNIAEDTRKQIVELYLNCEKNFFETLLIYEAIVRKKLITRQSFRIDQTKDLLHKTSVEDISQEEAANLLPIINELQQKINLKLDKTSTDKGETPATDDEEGVPADEDEVETPATDDEEGVPADEDEVETPATDDEEGVPADEDEVETPAIDEVEAPATDEVEPVEGETPVEIQPPATDEVETPATDEVEPVEGETPVEIQPPATDEVATTVDESTDEAEPAEFQSPVEGETPTEFQQPASEEDVPVEGETPDVIESPVESVQTEIPSESSLEESSPEELSPVEEPNNKGEEIMSKEDPTTVVPPPFDYTDDLSNENNLVDQELSSKTDSMGMQEPLGMQKPMEMSQPAVMPNPLPGMQNPMGMPEQPPVIPNQPPGMQNPMEMSQPDETPNQPPGMQNPMGMPEQPSVMQNPMGMPEQPSEIQNPMKMSEQPPVIPNQPPGMQNPMEMPQPPVIPNQPPGMQNTMGMPEQPPVIPNQPPGMQNTMGMPEQPDEMQDQSAEIQDPLKSLPEIQVPTNEQEKKEPTKNGLETIISDPSKSNDNIFNMFGGLKRKKFKSSNKMIEKFVNGFKRKTKKKKNKNNKKQTKRKNNTKKHVSKKNKNTKKKNQKKT